MKTYILKLKTTSTTNYNLYDGATLVSDSDLATLFGSAGSAYFTFDFNEGTPTDTTSLTILNSEDTAVMANTGLEGIAEDRNFKGVWADSATAFTAFTLLKGVAMDEAELTTLVGMVKNASGVKPLTTADYNWNSSTKTTVNPNCIGVWLLEPGIYMIAEQSVRVCIDGSGSSSYVNEEFGEMFRISMGASGASGAGTHSKCYAKLNDIAYVPQNISGRTQYLKTWTFLTFYDDNGEKLTTRTVLFSDSMNDLSSSSLTGPLSAVKGKELMDSIGDLSALTTAAKTSTVAAINELASSSASTFWGQTPVNGVVSGAIDFGDGATIETYEAEGTDINLLLSRTDGTYTSAIDVGSRSIHIGTQDTNTISFDTASGGTISAGGAKIMGVYDPQSAHDAATKGYVDGTTETLAIADTDWSALSSSDPYTYSATKTLTATIGVNSTVSLINDSAVDFATYGFAIGSVNQPNNTVTVYSIGSPSSSVNLKINVKGA